MSYSSFGAEPVVTKSPSFLPLTTCQEVQAAAELTELLVEMAGQIPKPEGIIIIQAAGHALGCPPKWTEVETTSDGRLNECTPEYAAAAMAAATSYPGLPQGTLEAINVVCGASPIAPAPSAQASTASGKSNFLPIALLVGGAALAVLAFGKK